MVSTLVNPRKAEIAWHCVFWNSAMAGKWQIPIGCCDRGPQPIQPAGKHGTRYITWNRSESFGFKV